MRIEGGADMPDAVAFMAEALREVLIDTENGNDISMDTHIRVQYALELYHKQFFEETIRNNEEVVEGC